MPDLMTGDDVTLATIVAANTFDPFDTVDALEAAMVEAMQGQPPIVIAPVHYFADGIYAREITIPTGAVVTGKIHRTAHLNVVSRGEISVWTEGEGLKRLRAPCTFVAGPGTRRVGFAHADTVWTTIHANPTDTQDLTALEAALIEPYTNPLLPMELATLLHGEGE